MSATATRFVAPAVSPSGTHQILHQRMLGTGYSTRDIAKVESALLSAHLHDTYLRAGYSPDDIAAITSLY
ncbi:MAG TPA: hypothetical protein VIJ20_00070 [Solirubrobacteraceae bacterium]